MNNLKGAVKSGVGAASDTSSVGGGGSFRSYQLKAVKEETIAADREAKGKAAGKERKMPIV
jgi:hypothetical protein